MSEAESPGKNLQEATDYIKSKISSIPEIGIILGTGLGSLVDGIKNKTIVEYENIPHFPLSTVESHHGRLLLGTLAGKSVVCMQGRFHYYEGYSFKQIVFPLRVMKRLGIKSLIVSNAAGGLNPEFAAGDIMLIADHINFFPGNPLIGINDDSIGLRFPDMYETYSFAYQKIAHQQAKLQNLSLKQGVYVGVTGPNLETEAEYGMFRILGGDAVGMSTVPEVIAARHQQTNVLAFSIITDMGIPGDMHPCSIEEVIRIAGEAEPKLRDLIAACVEKM